MDLEALGNLGDFIGGIAVVVTLIYLAVQVRQNNRQLHENAAATRAATVQSANDALIQLNISIAQSRELASYHIISAEDFEQLSPIDQRRCTALHISALRVFQHLFRQYESGLISTPEWEETRAGLVGVLRASGAKVIWDGFRDRGLFSRTFVDDVESAM